MTWHVEAETVRRYAEGTLPDGVAWSVEAHVSACDGCRARLDDWMTPVGPAGVDDARLAGVWEDVRAGVWTLERPLLERALVRCGLAEHEARLLAVTPSLTMSWLLGTAVVLAAGVAGAWLTRPGGGHALFPFLLLAPLIPVAGVGVAFGPRVDPTYALGIVAPLSSSRLLLLRSVAVLASSLVLAAVAALALPVVGWAAVAWLLPSLGLTATVLAGSARWHPLPTAGVTAVAWVAGVVVLETQSGGGLVAFGAHGQAAMLLLLIASLGVIATTRERVDPVARP